MYGECQAFQDVSIWGVKSQYRDDSLAFPLPEWRPHDQDRTDPAHTLAAENAAGGEPERTRCLPYLPSLRHLEAGLLQVEEAPREARGRRAVRPTPCPYSLAEGHLTGRDEQDPLPPPELPLRAAE